MVVITEADETGEPTPAVASAEVVAPPAPGQDRTAQSEAPGTQDDSDAEPENSDNKSSDDLQKKGKEEYDKGNYEAAVKAWQTSLKSVKYIIDKGFYKDKPEQYEEVLQISLKLHLNMSQGSLKLEDWRRAIEFADKVLDVDENHTKALYRKSVALIGSCEFKEGLATLDRLLNIEPENPAAKALHMKANRSALEYQRKSQKGAKRMFANLGDDPRVPPTRTQQFIDTLRNAPQEVSLLIEDLRWRFFDLRRHAVLQAQEFAASPLCWCRRRCKALVQSVHSTLSSEDDVVRRKRE